VYCAACPTSTQLICLHQEETQSAAKYLSGSGEIRIEPEKSSLTSRREILAHDVELDSIFNVFKVGLTLLITYVLRVMLDQARMAPSTFLERIATLPARQRFSEEFEHITFEYNHRDPTTMALLIACTETVNKLRLPMRSGRILKMAVEEPPQAPNNSDSG
jgi:hypothetical protein